MEVGQALSMLFLGMLLIILLSIGDLTLNNKRKECTGNCGDCECNDVGCKYPGCVCKEMHDCPGMHDTKYTGKTALASAKPTMKAVTLSRGYCSIDEKEEYESQSDYKRSIGGEVG